MKILDSQVIDVEPSGSWIKLDCTESYYEIIAADDTNCLWTAQLDKATLGDRVNLFEQAFRLFNGEPKGKFKVEICKDKDLLCWSEDKGRLGKRTIGTVALSPCKNPGALLRRSFEQKLIASELIEEKVKWEAERKQLLADREKAINARASVEAELYAAFLIRCNEYAKRIEDLEHQQGVDFWSIHNQPPQPDPSPPRNSKSERGRGRGRGRGTTASSSKTEKAESTAGSIAPKNSRNISPELATPAKRKLMVIEDDDDDAKTISDDERSTVPDESDGKEEEVEFFSASQQI